MADIVEELLAGEERGRRRLAQDVHDGPLQLLAIAAQELAEAEAGDPTALAAARGALQEGIDQLRDVLHRLAPDLVARDDFEGRLTSLSASITRQGGLRSTVEVTTDTRGRDELVLSVARELIANASRHADPSHVRVHVARDDDAVLVRVSDDGIGFEPDALRRALAGDGGLGALCRRAEALGGTLEALSGPTAGTVVTVRLPDPR